MGVNRGQHPDEKGTEIYRSITEEFGVSREELFQVWNNFAHFKYNEGQSSAFIIAKMKMSQNIFSPKALDCFIAIGLEMFAKEFVESTNAKN
jgi:hypothetical protein